jgi:hypothetical protein
MFWDSFSRMFKAPTPAQREHWDAVKHKGRSSFVLRVGVMQWGAAMFLIMTALDLMRKTSYPRSGVEYALDIAANLLIWPIAGYLFGLWMWRFYESYFADRK